MFPRLSPEGQAPGWGAGGGAGPSRDRGKRGRPSPRSLRPRVPAAPQTLSRGSHRAPRKAVTGCRLRWPPRRTRPRSPQIPPAVSPAPIPCRRCHDEDRSEAVSSHRWQRTDWAGGDKGHVSGRATPLLPPPCTVPGLEGTREARSPWSGACPLSLCAAPRPVWRRRAARGSLRPGSARRGLQGSGI